MRSYEAVVRIMSSRNTSRREDHLSGNIDTHGRHHVRSCNVAVQTDRFGLLNPLDLMIFSLTAYAALRTHVDPVPRFAASLLCLFDLKIPLESIRALAAAVIGHHWRRSVSRPTLKSLGG